MLSHSSVELELEQVIWSGELKQLILIILDLQSFDLVMCHVHVEHAFLPSAARPITAD